MYMKGFDTYVHTNTYIHYIYIYTLRIFNIHNWIPTKPASILNVLLLHTYIKLTYVQKQTYIQFISTSIVQYSCVTINKICIYILTMVISYIIICT